MSDLLKLSGSVLNLILMLQNEPFLDRNLASRVRQAREILGPHVIITIITNGSLLTEQKIDEIIRAGVDILEISIDAVNEDTYEVVRPGLNFQSVTQNTRLLLQRNGKSQVIARFLRLPQNKREEDSFREYWQKLGADIRFCQVTNRAGSLENFKQLASDRPHSFKQRLSVWLRELIPPCHDPFHSLNVLWDGRVILCCHDWSPRKVLGNFCESSLAQIWNNYSYSHFRSLLMDWRWQESEVCHDCSVVSDIQKKIPR